MRRRLRRCAAVPGMAAAVVLACVLALTAAGCPAPADTAAAADEPAAEPGPLAAAFGARVVNVEVTPVQPTTFVQYIRVVGEVEPMHDVTVSAQETGTIAAFLVAKGERLSRGQPVTRISSDLLDAQLEEANAILEIATERYERQRRLWEEQSIGTEMAVLEAKSQVQTSAARLKVLQTRKARTMVTSPIAGTYDEQYVEAGELVNPGTRLLRVLATDRVKVVAGIPERYALAIVPGTPAVVTFDVIEDREFEGTIAFVGVSVDRRSRTIPIEIVLDNGEGLIRPRLVANVQVERMRAEQVIVVPQDLVQRTETGFQVFVARQGSDGLTAEARAVELGASYANEVVVTAGLASGERLITAGHRQVDDGSVVSLVGG
jgi:RND family efflux transporter MFP subunit